jgi:hypothetical protein
MNARQSKFIKALTKFLATDESRKSIELQMGTPYGKSWSDLRGSTPLFGYYDDEDGLERAEEELTKFLYPDEELI